MAEELFRSADLVVRRVGGNGDACCVVTFDSFTDTRSLDRAGFGEAFFIQHGIDAVHVVPRDTEWYQYAALGQAMDAVRAVTRGYRRVVAYGSSMGAYAAIRLAGLAGADAVLALSPQYSIDPAVVGWELRWLECSRRFRAVWERTLPFPRVAEAYVVYDSRHIDRRHVALLASRFRFEPIAVPGVGHPVTGYLADVGLLQTAILDLCRGTLNATALAKEAIARRAESPQYLLAQAWATPRWMPGRRLKLLRKALPLAPDNPGIVSGFGVILGHAGHHAEALEMHRRALELAPGHPKFMQNQSFTLEASGDVVAALAVMEAIHTLTAGEPIYRKRLLKLRRIVAKRAVRWPWSRVKPDRR